MKRYAVVELENGNKCAVIDMLEYGNKKYFSLIQVDQDELSLGDEIIICRYNELKNCFEKIKNNEEYIFIEEIIEKRLLDTQNMDFILEQIKEKYLIKLKIVKIDGNDYILETETSKRILKNIDFYIKDKPKINSYIYMSKNIINEKNIFQYGNILNFNNINQDEIIKIEKGIEEYFLQRYYG